MKRRDFVASCGSLGALSAASQLAAIEPFKRPEPGQLRLSLAAYSLRQYLSDSPQRTRTMDLFGFVDYCHQHGLSGAELTSYYFPDAVDEEYLLRLRRHCHLRGVTVSGGAIRNDFCQPDAAKLQADLAHTRKWVDHYAVLGTPAIRIFAGSQPKEEAWETTRARCVAACEEACGYAAQRGIWLALENHGGVTAKSEGLLDIVRRVESPFFGVNFDSGNFHSTSDPYAELAEIAPYAVNAQIKVEIFPNNQRQLADLDRILKILRDAGYSGWVALEYEASEEPLEAIPRWLDKLRQSIG
jgi:sugar phosphate isomerase/epimerase